MQKTTKTRAITEHGVNFAERLKYTEYYKAVFKDYKELKAEYPFSYLCIPPTSAPSLAQMIVIAVNISTIARTGGRIDDFTGLYSRKLRVEIPIDYRQVGCKIYGGKWIEKNVIKKEYWHFNGTDDKYGNHNFCVGVPKSFCGMDNVLLENIRTADNMLTAYRRYITGKSDTLELIAYSHGKRGEIEYERLQK